MQSPASTSGTSIVYLRDLIDFVSHIADCYPDMTKDFPSDLVMILRTHHRELEPELREKIVSSLVLLRKKCIIDSTLSVRDEHWTTCVEFDGR